MQKLKHFIKKERTLVVLFSDHFVNDFYSLFLPIFVPALVLQFGINYLDAGILVSSVAIIGAILQSPVGYWADLYKKRVAALILSLPALAALFLSQLVLKEPRERGERGFTQAITLPIVLLIIILGLRGAVFQVVVSSFPKFFTDSLLR